MDENYWYNKCMMYSKSSAILAGATIVFASIALYGFMKPEKTVYVNPAATKYLPVQVAIAESLYNYDWQQFQKLPLDLQEMGYEKWCKDHDK